MGFRKYISEDLALPESWYESDKPIGDTLSKEQASLYTAYSLQNLAAYLDFSGKIEFAGENDMPVIDSSTGGVQASFYDAEHNSIKFKEISPGIYNSYFIPKNEINNPNYTPAILEAGINIDADESALSKRDWEVFNNNIVKGLELKIKSSQNGNYKLTRISNDAGELEFTADDNQNTIICTKSEQGFYNIYSKNSNDDKCNTVVENFDPEIGREKDLIDYIKESENKNNQNESKTTIPAKMTKLEMVKFAAKEAGIDGDKLAAFIQHESLFKERDVSSTGCTGLGQFSAETYTRTISRNHLKEKFPTVNFSDRKDAVANALVTAFHTENNLNNKIVNGDYTKAYLVHNLGASGGPKFIRQLEQNPNKTIDSDLLPGVLKNPKNFTKDKKLLTYKQAFEQIKGILDDAETVALSKRNTFAQQSVSTSVLSKPQHDQNSNQEPQRTQVVKLDEKELRDSLVKTAKSYLGKKEQGGNNRGKWVEETIKMAMPKSSEKRPPAYAWCAAMATRASIESGANIFNPQALNCLGARAHKIYAEQHGALYRAEEKPPQQGDFVYFTRGNNKTLGHVGIVQEVTVKDGKLAEIKTIEGNITVDRVKILNKHGKPLLDKNGHEITKAIGGVGNGNYSAEILTSEKCLGFCDSFKLKQSLVNTHEIQRAVELANTTAKPEVHSTKENNLTKQVESALKKQGRPLAEGQEIVQDGKNFYIETNGKRSTESIASTTNDGLYFRPAKKAEPKKKTADAGDGHNQTIETIIDPKLLAGLQSSMALPTSAYTSMPIDHKIASQQQAGPRPC